MLPEKLERSQYGWLEADIVLPVWSDRPLRVFIFGEQQDTLTPEQERAFEYLVENQAAIKATILALGPAYYEVLKERYAAQGFIPELQSPEIERAMSLRCVHLEENSENGVALTGYELDIDWEEEHGMGVRMCLGEIRGVGDGAFNFD
ncbi:MAG TPA: hypothetical protein VG944_13545 [Fimbriimonas sp.]|nr:hypothetical protein [Fimbriimonas sp.]